MTPVLLKAALELAVAQHNLEAAHSWLSMWVQVDAVSHRYILHRRQPRGSSGYRSRDQQWVIPADGSAMGHPSRRVSNGSSQQTGIDDQPLIVLVRLDLPRPAAGDQVEVPRTAPTED